MAQKNSESLPFSEIPPYPDTYSGGNVLSRMIAGLGFRYFWATEGLRSQDLEFKPGPDTRNTSETLDHIYILAETILNTAQNHPNLRPPHIPDLSFDEIRNKTLKSLQKASHLIQKLGENELASKKVIFERGESQTEFPLWNLINGQISDGLYHVGQVVSFRRTSGNPMDTRVNVFLGKIRK